MEALTDDENIDGEEGSSSDMREQRDNEDEGDEDGLEETDIVRELGHDGDERPHLFFTPPASQGSSPVTSPRRKEDTARRSKRFSLPALALHTTSVTARASMMVEDDGDVSRDDDASAASTPNRPKRFSIVLSPGKSGHGNAGPSVREDDNALAKSMAMDSLNELLHRHTNQG